MTAAKHGKRSSRLDIMKLVFKNRIADRWNDMLTDVLTTLLYNFISQFTLQIKPEKY